MNRKVIIYSSTGCEYCAKIKKELTEWGLTYEERNVTENPDYFNDLHQKGYFGTPVLFVDEKAFVGYRPNAVKKELGITEEAKLEKKRDEEEEKTIFQEPTKELLDEVYDLVCIGGGPAGASAAVYASRGKLKTLVVDKAPSAGTLAITHKIANYPGVREEVTGLELLTRMQKQAHDFGTTFVRTSVQSVDFNNEIKEIKVPEGTIKAKSVFIAVGAKGRSNKIKGEDDFLGRGVSYCSTCDAAFFAGKIVAVVGDNDEAVSEARTISKYAKAVKFLIPGKKLSGEADIDEVTGVDNIEIYWEHKVREISGEHKMEGIIVQTNEGERIAWDVDGVFLYLSGTKPGTDFLGDAVERDDDGYVKVDETLKTNIDGVYAGGDARRTPIKQAVIAAADGAIVAMSADKHVNKRSRMIPQYS